MSLRGEPAVPRRSPRGLPRAGSRAAISDFLAQRRIALVGASRDPRSFSRVLMRELERRGYEIVPVNPTAGEVAGKPAFRRVGEISPPVAATLVVTTAERSAEAVRDCLEGGVRRVWLHRGAGRGAVSEEAIALCREAGVEPVAGYCPLMFLPGSGLPHAMHAAVLRVFGRYPR